MPHVKVMAYGLLSWHAFDIAWIRLIEEHESVEIVPLLVIVLSLK